ncbi:MAG TPA: SET domain-containing protein-lysine N-methyltransferase [Gemmatimonadota bacterium]|nr:SET domain-containing protein-lysine N-methyltransferase [Gemmatimonadota bacterium]
MLRVATHLRSSSIHGIGVFAAERIPAGAEVWRFSPGFDLDLEPSVVDHLPRHLKDWFAHFGYVDFHLDRLVVCLDNARFINHSPVPNLRSDYSADRYGPDYAVRDIEAGEELTADYGEFERDPDARRSL